MLLQLLAVAPVVLVAVLYVGALLDCVNTPEERVRYAHKLLWLLFMFSAPIVGGLAWLYLGKRPEPSEHMVNTTKSPVHRTGPFAHQR